MSAGGGHTKRRFLAEWISAQFHDERGEWQPDRDVYEAVECKSLAEAQRVSIERGKAANVVEWARVSEERKTRYGWDTVRTWSGDWQYGWDEPVEYES